MSRGSNRSSNQLRIFSGGQDSPLTIHANQPSVLENDGERCHKLRKKFGTGVPLGGAALQRCVNCLLLREALAAEVALDSDH